MRSLIWFPVAVAMTMVGAVGCSRSDADVANPPSSSGVDQSVAPAPDVAAPQFVLDVKAAMAAIDADLGGPQDYFEVTANAQFTNVFVAVDDGSAAIPYTYIDGELQVPAPKQQGASGNTFAAADVDFVDDRILSGVSTDLPDSSIDALSVYGDGVATTYVIRATSEVGGSLDIVVGPDGNVFSVDPI